MQHIEETEETKDECCGSGCCTETEGEAEGNCGCECESKPEVASEE